MSTGTGTGTSTAAVAVARAELLIQQINAIVEGTTSSATFKEVIRKGIELGWIGKVFVRGMTSQGRILQQVEIEIDWKDHLLKINDPSQAKIEVRLDLPERSRISQVVPQIIDGFNEITQSKGLKAEWVVNYTPEGNAHSAEADRILGLVNAEHREWEPGTRESAIGPYKLKRLSELQLSWTVVTK
jgi:hypothetical protein